MALKHSFNSVVADEVSPGDRVQPSHWNADHVISGLARMEYVGVEDGTGFTAYNTANQAMWNLKVSDGSGNFSIERRDTGASGQPVIDAPVYIDRSDGKTYLKGLYITGYPNVRTTLDNLSARANKPWHTAGPLALPQPAGLSSSAFAAKGNIFRTDAALDIDMVETFMTGVLGTEQYRCSIHEVSGLTVSGNVVTAVTIGAMAGQSVATSPLQLGSVQHIVRFSFGSSPVALSANTDYAVFITRTNDISTFATPVPALSPSGTTGSWSVIGPGRTYIGSIQVAQTNPVLLAGMTPGGIGTGNYVYSMRGRFT